MKLTNIFEKQTDKKVVEIPLTDILPSRYQPRLHFDEESLEELTQSILQQGLIQPITVRSVEDHYEIIAGERRFRACTKAGFEKIPCYVLSPSESQAAQMALVENIQRKNLSAIEEAKSYVEIMRQAELTQEQMAQKIGKSQSSVANKIRLLNLPQDIQQGVIEQKITERHARALLTVEPAKQKKVYQEIIKKQLNVAETEEYIASMNQPAKVHKRQKTKGFTRNTQLAVNSVNQCVQMIHKLGIDCKVDQTIKDDEVCMVIHIPVK